jgi:hypothetical protein
MSRFWTVAKSEGDDVPTLNTLYSEVPVRICVMHKHCCWTWPSTHVNFILFPTPFSIKALARPSCRVLASVRL